MIADPDTQTTDQGLINGGLTDHLVSRCSSQLRIDLLDKFRVRGTSEFEPGTKPSRISIDLLPKRPIEAVQEDKPTTTCQHTK